MDEGTGAGEDRPKRWEHFDCATWLHKARTLPKEDFRRQVEVIRRSKVPLLLALVSVRGLANSQRARSSRRLLQ